MCGCVDMYIGVCGAMDMSLYIKVKINNITEIDILVLLILMNGLKIFVIFKDSSELFDKI